MQTRRKVQVWELVFICRKHKNILPPVDFIVKYQSFRRNQVVIYLRLSWSFGDINIVNSKTNEPQISELKFHIKNSMKTAKQRENFPSLSASNASENLISQFVGSFWSGKFFFQGKCSGYVRNFRMLLVNVMQHTIDPKSAYVCVGSSRTQREKYFHSGGKPFWGWKRIQLEHLIRILFTWVNNLLVHGTCLRSFIFSGQFL